MDTTAQWVEFLQVKRSRQDVLNRLASELGYEPDSVQVANQSMNLIGGLRSMGYEIPKERGFYHITGKHEPPTYRPASSWTGLEREVLNEIQAMPKVSLASRDWFDSSLASNANLHESCFAYLWSYEQATTKFFQYQSDDGEAVIGWKFANFPRLRIFNLSLPPAAVLSLGTRLSAASTRPIKVLHLFERELPEYRDSAYFGGVERRREAVYRLSRIPECLNSRGRGMVRKNRKEMQWSRVDPADAAYVRDATAVIEHWRDRNEDKHRQLAIRRDLISLELKTANDFHCIGYRDGVPCCLHVLTRLPKTPNVAGLLTEKSLNYSDVPGGKAGTADTNLVLAAEILLENGVEYINAGGYDGGGIGLPQHKQRFALPEDDIQSLAVTLSCPVIDLEKYRIVKDRGFGF